MLLVVWHRFQQSDLTLACCSRSDSVNFNPIPIPIPIPIHRIHLNIIPTPTRFEGWSSYPACRMAPEPYATQNNTLSLEKPEGIDGNIFNISNFCCHSSSCCCFDGDNGDGDGAADADGGMVGGCFVLHCFWFNVSLHTTIKNINSIRINQWFKLISNKSWKNQQNHK